MQVCTCEQVEICLQHPYTRSPAPSATRASTSPRRLLDSGQRVITLTNSPDRANPSAAGSRAVPVQLRPTRRAGASRSTASTVLYNTYWVRFNHPLFTHADAVRNTLALFEAARQAGVQPRRPRQHHQPVGGLAAGVFPRQGAARAGACVESGLSYAILRPTVLFGKEDILINNIAWVLRHLPVFGVFGDGQYRLAADLRRRPGRTGASSRARAARTSIINAIGPETFTYRELVRDDRPAHRQARGRSCRCRRRVGYLAGRLIGALVGDVMITREEIAGLMADLLYVDSPPAGTTRLTDWAHEHAGTLGRRYASELARRRDRQAGYRSN